jgi:C4-dicarboxylate-specific signal transduction histidine kinase
VSVTDEGAGMTEDQLARIFEPFFSTKKLGERSGSGFGLGLHARYDCGGCGAEGGGADELAACD